jgi:hypothetical protein
MYATKSKTSRFLLVTTIYLSLLLDNILLTVVGKFEFDCFIRIKKFLYIISLLKNKNFYIIFHENSQRFLTLKKHIIDAVYVFKDSA